MGVFLLDTGGRGGVPNATSMICLPKESIQGFSDGRHTSTFLPAAIRSRPESELVMWLNRCAIAMTAVAVMGQSAAQDQAPRPMNQYERQAIEIVNHWMSVWQTNDADKMTPLLTEDFEFSDASGHIRSGRDLYLRCMKNRLVGRVYIKNVSYQAVGDRVFTLVLQRRTDTIPKVPPGNPLGPLLDGNHAGRIGAFFLIKDGKIAAWLDYAVAVDLPPPPANPAAQAGCN
jgi:hypothetical protein